MVNICIPNICSCFVPIWSGLNLFTQPLDVINEHAAARRLAAHDDEAGEDLPHAADDAAHVDGDDAQTVPETQENSNWNIIHIISI